MENESYEHDSDAKGKPEVNPKTYDNKAFTPDDQIIKGPRIDGEYRLFFYLIIKTLNILLLTRNFFFNLYKLLYFL